MAADVLRKSGVHLGDDWPANVASPLQRLWASLVVAKRYELTAKKCVVIVV